MSVEEKEQAAKELLRYINATPDLLSLLYDMNLMPEQLPKNGDGWRKMMILAAWHRGHFAKA